MKSSSLARILTPIGNLRLCARRARSRLSATETVIWIDYIGSRVNLPTSVTLQVDLVSVYRENRDPAHLPVVQEKYGPRFQKYLGASTRMTAPPCAVARGGQHRRIVVLSNPTFVALNSGPRECSEVSRLQTAWFFTAGTNPQCDCARIAKLSQKAPSNSER